MKKPLLLFISLVICVIALGQKPPLDSSVYDGWKSIGTQLISEDGKWIVYSTVPQQGDGWLHIYNTVSGRKDSAERGGRPLLGPGSKYLAYQVIPRYAETRQAKKKKLKEDKMPKNGLEIRLLDDGSTKKIERVKSFDVPEKGSQWMAYLLEKKAEEKKDAKTASDSTKSEPVPPAKKGKTPEKKGSELIIYNPLTSVEHSFPDVTEFVLAKDGGAIGFLQSFPDTLKIENLAIKVFDTKSEKVNMIFEGKGTVKKLTSDKTGKHLSFLFSPDTARVKVYELYLSSGFSGANKIVPASDKALPKNSSASENGAITFSDDAARLYFGSALRPAKEPVDTLLEEEKYKLDIWSWDDDLLQPMQKKQLDQEKKRTWQAVYHTASGKIVQLADSLMPSVRTYQKGNSRYALGSSDLRYRRESSWEGSSPSDYYLVNTETGERTPLAEKCSGRAMLSPSCKYFVYWDNTELDWFSVATGTNAKVNISSAISFPLYDELNDVPDDPNPHGIAAWVDDEKHVLIYDRYDVWLADLDGKEKPVNLTNGYGRSNNLRFRYLKLDEDVDFIGKKEALYFSGFDYDTKEAGFFISRSMKQGDPERLMYGKYSFSRGLSKAKNADTFMWTRGTFIEYPEIYVSNNEFRDPKKVSLTNPQQSKYNWVSVELVEWESFDNKMLQGLLFKPEDFDPAKKYPMIVYFYEKSSDELYNYVAPVPSASIVNKTFAVSNGYLLFVPDIPYRTGYPGQSCYNSVISGTTALLSRYPFIDRTRLALDGQSWGGYQIAWLVTQTDLFACAYAGAPVVNMTSAYGGIRWESGMSRMFQYEHTQSRIGGTLWEKPVHYIENSPIFFVPKINTPLLLMHNDADGAVPWYQGIEFITALRRLEKPAWLLSYNDEAHNLVRRANRKDISIRKMQFFDHYLKGVPMPYWMKYGISQTEKGKVDGYDLVKD